MGVYILRRHSSIHKMCLCVCVFVSRGGCGLLCFPGAWVVYRSRPADAAPRPLSHRALGREAQPGPGPGRRAVCHGRSPSPRPRALRSPAVLVRGAAPLGGTRRAPGPSDRGPRDGDAGAAPAGWRSTHSMREQGAACSQRKEDGGAGPSRDAMRAAAAGRREDRLGGWRAGRGQAAEAEAQEGEKGHFCGGSGASKGARFGRACRTNHGRREMKREREKQRERKKQSGGKGGGGAACVCACVRLRAPCIALRKSCARARSAHLVAHVGAATCASVLDNKP